MKWIWFPVAVLGTSVALVAALGVIGAFAVRPALASGLGASAFAGYGPWSGGPWHGGGAGFTLPSELQGLGDIPADQRFAHFAGAQVSLKDKDGKPVVIAATPGTVTTASATSLTVAANDGTAKTFALDAQTILRGQHTAAGSPANGSALATGDSVVVVTLNQSTTATAVVDGGPHGFSWAGAGHPWGPPATGG
jgi:hypothetical protein